jgi:hypothetical protein
MGGFKDLSGVKTRVKNIFNYKKPAFWIILVAIIACIAVPICFTTSKKNDSIVTTPTSSENIVLTNYNTPIEVNTKEHTEYEWVEIWANAFCERDGNKFASMVGDSAVNDLKENIDFEYITLENGEQSATFGWSSPWPWGEYPYDIRKAENGQAEITYYAITSDPHITVWNETLTYEITDIGFKVTSESLTFYDNISSIDEYNKAYPDGIGQTMMDYTNNGLGFDEALNNNALANKSVYSDLFSPDMAAIYILNLNKDAVTITIEPDENGFSDRCYAIIIFKNDTSSASVKVIMTRYDETSGIWLPYTVPARYSNYIESDNADIGQIGEDGNYYSKSDISKNETEVVVSETTADLNHDGINDLIQLVAVTDKHTAEAISTVNDIKKILTDNISLFYVKVYRGISSNTYEEQAYFVSRSFGLPHVGNGFNCLTYVDGEAYFIIGSFWEGQGFASYGYNVFYLDDEQGAVVVQSDSVEFIAWEEGWGDSWSENLHRDDVMPDFEEKLNPYLENAEIIICQDIDEGSFSNITGKCPASEYFDIIWERSY